MLSPFNLPYALVGIDTVATREDLHVSHVDIATCDAGHAALLEWEFQIHPFSCERAGQRIFVFTRVPAAAAREWMEQHYLPFELRGSMISALGHLPTAIVHAH